MDVSTVHLKRHSRGRCFGHYYQQGTRRCRICRRRNIGARRPVGRNPRQEQFKNRGVYINVFEQSILTDNRPNKPWSLLASLSAELLVVSVMILIPLIYGDHLTDFHWRVITVGPPVRRVEPRPETFQRASGAARV